MVRIAKELIGTTSKSYHVLDNKETIKKISKLLRAKDTMHMIGPGMSSWDLSDCNIGLDFNIAFEKNGNISISTFVSGSDEQTPLTEHETKNIKDYRAIVKILRAVAEKSIKSPMFEHLRLESGWN